MDRSIFFPALLLPLLGLFLPACGPVADPPAPGPGLPGERSFTFSQLEVDRVPPEFTVFTGDWQVQIDPEGGSNVLAQLAPSAGHVFNLVLADDVEFADLEISTRVYALSGKIDRGGGLVWRAQDGGNYYICRWNPLESNFRLYKVIDGDRIQLASAAATAQGGWHEMRATMKGRRIECWLDEEKLLTTEDEALKKPGRVGLWTKADAVTLCDSLEVAGK